MSRTVDGIAEGILVALFLGDLATHFELLGAHGKPPGWDE